jgi:hypothetical protein
MSKGSHHAKRRWQFPASGYTLAFLSFISKHISPTDESMKENRPETVTTLAWPSNNFARNGAAFLVYAMGG